jgi:hypothetical protein
MSEDQQPPERPYSAIEGEWGYLANEPCRYCHEVGGIFFLIDDGPEGKTGLSPIRCDRCKRTWTPDSSNA